MTASRFEISGSETVGAVSRFERFVHSRAAYAWIPVTWLILFFVSNFRFSGGRDPSLASAGVASPENAIEIAVYGSIGVVALAAALAQRQRLRSTGLWLLGSFGVLAVTSALWSRVALFSLVRGSQVVVIALLAFVSAGTWAAGRRSLLRDWQRIWTWFVVVAAVLTVVSLLAGSYVEGRFTWFGQHPGTTGGLLGIAALVSLSMAIERGWGFGGRLRLAMSGLAVGALVAMVLSISRTQIVAFLIAALVLYVASARSRLDLRVLWAVAIVAIVVAVLFTFGSPIFQFVSRDASIEQMMSLTGRTELWAYSFQVLARAPYVGFGYGAGRQVLFEVIPWAGTGHNLWVEAAVSLGLTGLILVTSLLIWMGVTALRIQQVAPGPVGHVALALVVFETIAAVTGEAFSIPGTGLTLAALLVAGLSAHRRVSEVDWFGRRQT